MKAKKGKQGCGPATLNASSVSKACAQEGKEKENRVAAPRH